MKSTRFLPLHSHWAMENQQEGMERNSYECAPTLLAVMEIVKPETVGLKEGGGSMAALLFRELIHSANWSGKTLISLLNKKNVEREVHHSVIK